MIYHFLSTLFSLKTQSSTTDMAQWLSVDLWNRRSQFHSWSGHMSELQAWPLMWGRQAGGGWSMILSHHSCFHLSLPLHFSMKSIKIYINKTQRRITNNKDKSSGYLLNMLWLSDMKWVSGKGKGHCDVCQRAGSVRSINVRELVFTI